MATSWRPEEKATADIQTFCIQIKPDVEAAAKQKFNDFMARRFIYGINNDKINYIVKVQAGVDTWLHVWMIQDMPCHGGKLVYSKYVYKNEPDPIVEF